MWVGVRGRGMAVSPPIISWVLNGEEDNFSLLFIKARCDIVSRTQPMSSLVAVGGGGGVVVVARVGGADQQAGPRKHKQHRRRQNDTRRRKGKKRNKKPRRSHRDDGNELMKLPLEETPAAPADARSSHICVSERSPPVSRQALCPPRLEH